MDKLTIPTEDALRHFPNLTEHKSTLLGQLQQTGTPVFFCERGNLIERYRALASSLGSRWGPHIIGYSFKTNYLVARCGVPRELGAWAEVVSGREYRLARALGFAGENIIFNGPYKSDRDLETALADRALLNVNDHDELDKVIALTTRSGTSAEIGLRVSFTLPKLGHSRFGFSLENSEIDDALRSIRGSRLRLVGLHTHLYGDTDDPEIYAMAARRLGEFAQSEIPDDREALRFIDMGGGFPAHSPKPKSRESWNPRPIDEYMWAITESLRSFFPDRNAAPTLIVEPGRYLTGDGILLVLRVHHVKQREGRQHINSNGSISMMPLTHYCPQILRAYTAQLLPRTTEQVPTTIFGATCRENDVLFEGDFSRTQVGDYLVFFAAGAYNSSLSPDFIFKSPRMQLF